MGQCCSKQEKYRHKGNPEKEHSTENGKAKAAPQKEVENKKAEPENMTHKTDKDRNSRLVEQVDKNNPVVVKKDVSAKPDKGLGIKHPTSTPPSKPKKQSGKKKKSTAKSSDSSSSGWTDSSASSESSDSSYGKEKSKVKQNGNTIVYSKSTSKTIVKGNIYNVDNRKGILNVTKIGHQTVVDDKYSGLRYNQEDAKQEERLQTTELGTGRGCFINLRKIHLAQESVLNVKVRGEVSSWVGILKLQARNKTCSGTCFRVGANKIMTALHVFKMMLDLDYQSVHHERVSDIFEGHGQEETGDNSQAQTYINAFAIVNNYASVDFGYLLDNVHEPNERDVYKLKPLTSLGDVQFYDKKTDCVVLEILPNHLGNSMPGQFSFFSVPKLDEGFHLIGHPDGNKKTCDQIDSFIDPGKETTKQFIHEIKRESKKLLSRNNKKDLPFDQENTILSRERFLFHCTFGKGASGSPGFVVDNEGRAIVLTMLLHGYPDWYYDEKSAHFRKDFENKCIEQGVSMVAVYNAMRLKNPILCREIFPEPEPVANR